MSAASVELQSATPAAAAAPRQTVWIHSPAFDLAFLTFSPLVGIALLLAAPYRPAGLFFVFAVTYLLGIPHYLSSFTFYLGEENLAHYWSRRAAFFVGPMFIASVAVALQFSPYDYWLQAAVILWNVYHVSLQSSGIVSLYRHLNGGGLAEKRWAKLTILAVNCTCLFWHIERFPMLLRLLQPLHAELPGQLRYGFAAAAIFSALMLSRTLLRRSRPITGAELGVLCTSLLMFHPYLWVHDIGLASLATLAGHFLQYLGIVWLLNGRKYSTSSARRSEQWLARLGQNAALLICTISAVGLAFFALEKTLNHLGVARVYATFFYVLVLTHFYVDGLVWAFRSSYVRHTVGRYLAQQTGDAA
jgi:hypothetical protein